MWYFYSIYCIWFIATSNNISMALLMEETGLPRENITDMQQASYWQTLSHNVVSSTPDHVPDWITQRKHYWHAASKLLSHNVVSSTPVHVTRIVAPRDWPLDHSATLLGC